MEQLTQEKENAEQIAGDAVAEMHATGQMDEQRSAELSELRQMLLVQTAEVSRLQLPLLTDQSGSDPELPARLASTVTYLRQCTDAFNTLNSEATLKLQGATHEQQKLTSQLADSQVKADDLARQLAVARAETDYYHPATLPLAGRAEPYNGSPRCCNAVLLPRLPPPAQDRRWYCSGAWAQELRRRRRGAAPLAGRFEGRSRDRADPSRRHSSQRDDREQDGDVNRSSRRGLPRAEPGEPRRRRRRPR